MALAPPLLLALVPPTSLLVVASRVTSGALGPMPPLGPLRLLRLVPAPPLVPPLALVATLAAMPPPRLAAMITLTVAAAAAVTVTVMVTIGIAPMALVALVRVAASAAPVLLHGIRNRKQPPPKPAYRDCQEPDTPLFSCGRVTKEICAVRRGCPCQRAL